MKSDRKSPRWGAVETGEVYSRCIPKETLLLHVAIHMTDNAFVCFSIRMKPDFLPPSFPFHLHTEVEDERHPLAGLIVQ